MKYILVTGGVISGVGKGVIASAFGALLQHIGIPVTCIKIDPYINIDAGTFSPFEHGEVFVLNDGGEVDLDMGNYERFLDITLRYDNNITTGKIFQRVIQMERDGKFLGKTVQIIPHVTDTIQHWIERVAKKSVNEKDLEPEVCIIELGGTVGDAEYLPFVEALGQMQRKVGKDNFFCAHVSLVPIIATCHEFKTKPTQTSITMLRSMGMQPDVIFARSEVPINERIITKLSNFCSVATSHVITIPDFSTVYEVPLSMASQGVIEILKNGLKLTLGQPLLNCSMDRWQNLVKLDSITTRIVTIALVGKYTEVRDAYTSVTKALQHACSELGYKLNLQYIESTNLEVATKETDPSIYDQAWLQLRESQGVIIPGGFGKRGLAGMIDTCQWCRTNDVPFLGICLGFQMAVIEFARNVLDIPEACSTEIDPTTKYPLITEMPEYNPSQKGATMRLGLKKTYFKTGYASKVRALYSNKTEISERHRHRYEVNMIYVEQLERAGLKFVGRDERNERMEIFELEGLKYYVATQFHPEFLTRPFKPSPPYLGLILASAGILSSHNKKQRQQDDAYHQSIRDGDIAAK